VPCGTHDTLRAILVVHNAHRAAVVPLLDDLRASFAADYSGVVTLVACGLQRGAVEEVRHACTPDCRGCGAWFGEAHGTPVYRLRRILWTPRSGTLRHAAPPAGLAMIFTGVRHARH
jgi:hypothetical protein